MQKITTLFTIVLAISGCDKLETTLGNGPVGRYQMVSSSQPDGVSSTFILDTKNGTAWKLQENEFWPFPVVKSDAASRNADLKARLARLEAAAKQRGIPVAEQSVIPQGEKSAATSEDKIATLKALRAELATEKQKRGLPLKPEELEALNEMTASQ